MKPKTSLKPYAKSDFAEAIPVLPLSKNGLDTWLKKQSDDVNAWIDNIGFKAEKGRHCYIPGERGALSSVLLGMGKQEDPWLFGILPSALAPQVYRVEASGWNKGQLEAAALAWGLGAYRYGRYRKPRHKAARLCLSSAMDYDAVENTVTATYLVRDLINTPAEDMMPGDIAEAAEALARSHGAQVELTVGDQLLASNFPLIHAVGRASQNDPLLIDMQWGALDRPKVTLVGKGVCFDSGGLDIKSSAGMRLMKKDMGGGAHVMGLAHMIMAAKLPVRLRVLIPAVENAISGNAYRPGDVLLSRQGLTVEIENTDAEGRLVLCDALTEAASEKPDLIIDFATLTGAARVALGTELPALFANNNRLSKGLVSAAEHTNDPIWPLPLHEPYLALLKSDFADIANASGKPFAGAITAALFLREFVPADLEWAHLDVMGWNTCSRPGHPSGGEAMGMRTVFHYLKHRFG